MNIYFHALKCCHFCRDIYQDKMTDQSDKIKKLRGETIHLDEGLLPPPPS